MPQARIHALPDDGAQESVHAGCYGRHSSANSGFIDAAVAMKLISWNTNRRKHKADGQIRVLLSRRPDVIALQEVTAATMPLLARGLRDGGLQHIASSVAEPMGSGPRAFGVLIASRLPFAAALPRLPIPWEEKSLSVVVGIGGTEVEVHSVHVPPGSTNRWIKVEVLEGIARGLSLPSSRHRILCGDFNAPNTKLARATS